MGQVNMDNRDLHGTANMSDNIPLLPNAVGRIDAIVEAIEQGDRWKTLQLLHDEHERLNSKARLMIEQLNRIFEARNEVFMVKNNFSKDASYFSQVHKQIRAKS